MTFNGGGGLAFSDLGWLFIKLTAMNFRQRARLFTRPLEAAQGEIERFIFSYFD